MLRSNIFMARFAAKVLQVTLFLFPLANIFQAQAESEMPVPVYSPSVNIEGLRGLTTVGSAEAMGEGRITFGFFMPGYKQHMGYLNTPNAGALLFTGTGAFTYGVNSNVDIFGSIATYSSSNYTNTNKQGGLGTIRAGVQGSLPFPKTAFVRMGGQLAMLGGMSQNRINTYRADGYNYFETRDGWDIMGKLMQTVQFGGEDLGVKLHLNEGGVIGIIKSEPALLLLSAGLQGNIFFAVLGMEINSRTRFGSMAFDTDPLWVTPSIHLRTPWNTNVLAGVDISLSADRSDNNPQALDNPRALEPYRFFGALAFSIDAMQGRRKAEFAAKEKAAREKAALERQAVASADRIESLSRQSVTDSVTLANEKRDSRMQMDSMQRDASDAALANREADSIQAKKTTADSLALVQAASDLSREKEMRSDAEKQLLSTGEMLLDAVYFESGKTVITINSKSYLNVIAKMLRKYPKLQFEVSGHTDNIGADNFNVTLSQQRADAVKFYLNEVAPDLRLSARGYGMSSPKADNNTKEGRLSNRRVELRVTNMDALQEYSQK